MKTKSKKILYAVIAMSVACFLACSALLVIGRVDRGGEPAASAPAENGGMLIGESEGAGVSLLSEKIAKADYAAYGVSPLADSAYTLTATVEPANAPDKSVDWSVAFVNPSSSWATGKTVTDYVTVTPTSDGALTATVACLQAFGEQIKVTVTSRQDETVKTECMVDYAQRISGVSLNLIENTESKAVVYNIGNSSSFKLTQTYSAGQRAEDEMLLDYTFTYFDYTIEQNFDVNQYIQFSSELGEKFEENGFTLKNGATDKKTFEKTLQLSVIPTELIEGLKTADMFNIFGRSGELYNRYATALHAFGSEKPVFTIELSATNEYSSFTKTVEIMFDIEEIFPFSVETIELNQGSIIF